MSYFGESASGFSGYSGNVGATGTSGFSGYSGKSGFSGTNGGAGATGTSGFSGYSGKDGSGGAGITWQETSAGFVQLAEGDAYIANRVGPITFQMPQEATMGSIVAIAGKGLGGWTLAFNEGQQGFSSNFGMTSPDGGVISSTSQYDCVELICIADSTHWNLRNSSGNPMFG